MHLPVQFNQQKFFIDYYLKCVYFIPNPKNYICLQRRPGQTFVNIKCNNQRYVANSMTDTNTFSEQFVRKITHFCMRHQYT